MSKIKCNKCGDIIVSRSRHDMVWCKCKSVAVDGGDDYTRIIGNREDWEYVTDDQTKYTDFIKNMVQ